MPEVYPVGSDTNFSEQSDLNSEKDVLLAGGDRAADYVVDPFSGGDYDLTNPSGTDAKIAAGDAIIAGHLVRFSSSVTLTLDTNATCQIYILVDDDFTDNVAIQFETGGTSPTDPNDNTPQHSYQIWEATTDGSTITGQTNYRDWVPHRGDDPLSSTTGRQTGTKTFDGDVTGVQTKTVSLPQDYLTATDSTVATLDKVSDNSIAFDIPPRVKPSTVDTTGFDVEAKLAAAGPSGATFDVRWASWGR